MAIRDPNNFGKPISNELAEYIRSWTEKAEMEDVAKKCNVSYSTLRDVIYSQNNLTKNNVEAVEEITRVAVKNYTLKKNKHEKTTKKIAKLYENNSD